MVIDERRKITYLKGENTDDDRILFDNIEYFKNEALERLAKKKEIEKIEKRRKEFEQEEPSKEEWAAQEKAIMDSIYVKNEKKKSLNLNILSSNLLSFYYL